MWLTVEQAAKHYGYGNPESLRQRIRQLRDNGKVSDVGASPPGYRVVGNAPINVLWANPKSMMIADDAPPDLLNPHRGRRTIDS